MKKINGERIKYENDYHRNWFGFELMLHLRINNDIKKKW